MIDDASNVESGQRIESDVCVIGAGAAGITIARELRRTGLAVTLLEAGRETATAEDQSFYRGKVIGHDYYPLESSRLRFFGGTTNHWGGMSIPFDPIDFERRPWVPNSGWPIEAAALDPFLARAHEACEIGPTRYEEEFWAPQRNKPLFPIRGGDILPRIAQFSPPTRFGPRYREDLERAPEITTLLGANVVEIVPNAEVDRIVELAVSTVEGLRFTVAARAFVLATGAIENARLLLASRSRQKEGLGNAHDVVGRYFMERVNRKSGILLPVDATRIVPFFEQDRIGNMGINGYLGTSPAWQRREQVLNSSIHLHVSGSLALAETEGGATALRRVRTALSNGEIPDGLGSDLWQILWDLDELAADAWDRWRGGSEPEPPPGAGPVVLDIWHDVEPVPNPESRVTLTDSIDPLGMPRIALDWQLSPELEGRTIRSAFALLGADAGRLGIGRARLDIGTQGDAWVPEVVGSFHQMGTTRMSANPKEGVVDADCRVHGLDNLYVAGSSVFTTAGQANPTMCLLQLALRLADHLRAELPT